MNLIPKDGYWLSSINIKKIEELKNAQYMGYWCTKRPSGGWNESPVDVFYVENPNTDLGHTNYFGMFYDMANRLMITDALSAFSEPITGIKCADGTIIVSRYRHDYVTHDDCMIDGGRDYVKSSPGANSSFVSIIVNNNEFNVEKINA